MKKKGIAQENLIEYNQQRKDLLHHLQLLYLMDQAQLLEMIHKIE
jgi:hypothetical protein